MNVSRPKIAIDARLIGTQSTGDATYWRGLIDGLNQNSPSADFLLFSNAKRPDVVPESPAMQWIQVPGSQSRWWSLVQFPLAARKAGASVIHSQYALSPLVGKRGVTTIHDVSFFIEPNWFKTKDRILLQNSCKLASKIARRIITVSNSSKGEIERYLPAAQGNVRVTYPACGLGIAAMSKSDAESMIQNELKLAPPFLLTVGTRWPRKNMRLAIEATALLGPESPKLVITGKPGWGNENLHSHVVTTGYVSDELLSALYSVAELYLAPSRHEGFGITLLEAFSCGCPVICSSGGAHPEVAGNAAQIVHSFEAPDWAEEIRRLLPDSSKLDQMRALGRARSSEFSWSKMAEQTMEIYSEVAG